MHVDSLIKCIYLDRSRDLGPALPTMFFSNIFCYGVTLKQKETRNQIQQCAHDAF